MLTPRKRSNEDIETLEKEVEDLQKKRAQMNSPEADTEVLEAEEVINNEEAPKEERNMAKRFKDTKSAWFKERNQWEKREAELKEQIDQLKASNPSNLPTSAEELEEFTTEYPQVASALRALVDSKVSERVQDLNSKLSSLEEQNVESQVELVKAKIKKTHPDFDKLADSTEFHDWVETKPSWVADALYSGLDAQTAIDAINLYKVEQGVTTEEAKRETPRKNKKEDAAKVGSSPTTTLSDSTQSTYLKESEVLSWTDEEFIKNMDRYNEAKRTGKLVLDVSQKKQAS